LLKEFEQMQTMMKKMSGGGMMKMMKKLGGMKGMRDGRWWLSWHALNLSRSPAALRPQGFFNDGATQA
jgi:hypothetical protein